MKTKKRQPSIHKAIAGPTVAQLAWLKRGLSQPGGKLPLFDNSGQRVNSRTIKSCISRGWAEPWFSNPIKPDWLVCKLTKEGRRISERYESQRHL